MSKPRYRWWGFVRRMIRDYPGLKEAVDDLHSQNVTASMTGMPRGGGAGRTVETIALRQLPEDDQKAYDAVTRAVEITRLRPDGEERVALIRYTYWCRTEHPLKHAALYAHVSERTAKRWHGDFVRLVGKCYGFDVVGTPEPNKFARVVESES